jgi:hypothetical protein
MRKRRVCPTQGVLLLALMLFGWLAVGCGRHEMTPVLSTGTLHLEVSGAFELTDEMSLSEVKEWSAPGGHMDLEWDGRAGGLILAGPTSVGVSNETSITVLLVDANGVSYEFAQGTGDATRACTVTLERAAAGDLGGSFACIGLTSRGRKIDALGQFVASSNSSKSN